MLQCYLLMCASVGDRHFGAPSKSAPGARAPLSPPKGRPWVLVKESCCCTDADRRYPLPSQSLRLLAVLRTFKFQIVSYCLHCQSWTVVYPGVWVWGFNPPRNSEVLTKLSRIPSSVENNPLQPNNNTRFTHLQTERNPRSPFPLPLVFN
jgi:hypothetical protein